MWAGAVVWPQVKVSECLWTLEDGSLHVTLGKAQQGEPWKGALQGHEDVVSAQQDQVRSL